MQKLVTSSGRQWTAWKHWDCCSSWPGCGENCDGTVIANLDREAVTLIWARRANEECCPQNWFLTKLLRGGERGRGPVELSVGVKVCSPPTTLAEWQPQRVQLCSILQDLGLYLGSRLCCSSASAVQTLVAALLRGDGGGVGAAVVAVGGENYRGTTRASSPWTLSPTQPTSAAREELDALQGRGRTLYSRRLQ